MDAALLCRLMLTDEKYLTKQEKENWLSKNLTKVYGRSLEWTLKHKKSMLSGTLVLLVVALAMFFNMGQSFLPDFNEGSLTISAVCKPGVSLYENNNLGNIIERELLSIPEVTSTARRTGRGELDEHSQSTNGAEIDVNFDLKDRSQEEFLTDVREKLASIPGIASTVGHHRLSLH